MKTEIHPKLKRAFELRKELFDIANSFAGDETGHIAVELHESCNCILRANNMLHGKPAQDPFEAMHAMNNHLLATLMDSYKTSHHRNY